MQQRRKKIRNRIEIHFRSPSSACHARGLFLLMALAVLRGLLVNLLQACFVAQVTVVMALCLLRGQTPAHLMIMITIGCAWTVVEVARAL